MPAANTRHRAMSSDSKLVRSCRVWYFFESGSQKKEGNPKWFQIDPEFRKKWSWEAPGGPKMVLGSTRGHPIAGKSTPKAFKKHPRRDLWATRGVPEAPKATQGSAGRKKTDFGSYSPPVGAPILDTFSKKLSFLLICCACFFEVVFWCRLFRIWGGFW